MLAALWWVRRRGKRADVPTVEAVDTLIGWAPEATRVLTQAELRAFGLLTQALPRHMVLAQVSLARFIKVPMRHSYAEWLRRVGHLSADLVVCNLQSQVLAVLEVRPMRERSDERAIRRRQRFSRVLKAVGIPLHVWAENAMPTVDEVRRLFAPKPSLAEGAGAAGVRADEVIDMREPPSSTWFDEFDSGVAPLDPPRGGKR